MVQNNDNHPPDSSVNDSGEALDLKAIRESKGLTLKDIFKMTRISVVNLEAIENNDLHLLPAPVYTKTFIKTYARALGVDSENILARYAKHLESLKKPGEEQAEPSPRKFSIPTPVLIWSVAALVFCTLIFLSLTLRDTSDMEVRSPLHSPEPTPPAAVPEAPPAPVPPQAATPGTGTPKAKISAQTAAPVPAERNGERATVPPAPYRVSITARELTWVNIVLDQNPPAEIMLNPGDRIERSAAASIRLDIGNAGGIDLEFQGKPMGTLGKSGEVVHLTLP